MKFGKDVGMVFGQIPFDLFVIHDAREVLDRNTQGEGVVSIVIPDCTQVLLERTHRVLHMRDLILCEAIDSLLLVGL